MILKVPYHKQHKDYTCGPRCIQMVLEYFGIKSRVDNLVRDMKTNKDIGTVHSEMIKKITDSGLYCYVNKNGTLAEIIYFVEQEHPVIVNYIEPKDNDGHYAVLIGHNKKKLILNDPWIGKKFKISKKEFIDRWEGKYNNVKRWFLVASKEDFQLGRQYLPTGSETTEN